MKLSNILVRLKLVEATPSHNPPNAIPPREYMHPEVSIDLDGTDIFVSVQLGKQTVNQRTKDVAKAAATVRETLPKYKFVLFKDTTTRLDTDDSSKAKRQAAYDKKMEARIASLAKALHLRLEPIHTWNNQGWSHRYRAQVGRR